MSDPKSGTYVSLTDDRSDEKKEQEEEECAVDSGFISSSSVFLSGAVLSDDEEDEPRVSEPIVEALRTDPSQRGPNQQDRGRDEKQSEKEHQSTYLDSGVIDDQEFEADEVETTPDNEMRVEKSLNEWMCDLSLKENHNNLDDCGSTKPTVSPMEALKHMPLWQVCYTQDEEGDTQLHLSIIAKYPEAVWTIIRIAPDQRLLDIRNEDGQCAMHLAVLSSQPTIIRQLMVTGAQTSIRDRDGNTPLHLACINSDLNCVRALTAPLTTEERQSYRNADRKSSKSADLEQRNYDGEYCVHIAAQRNEIDILRQLVKSGANINVREGRCGYTALHYACVNSNEALVNYILSECTQLQVETCSFGLLTAYQLAADQRNETLMQALKVYGAELLTPPDSEEDYTSDEDEEARTEDTTSTNSKHPQSIPAHQSQQQTIAPCS